VELADILAFVRLLALASLAAGVYAIFRWDMQDGDIISSGNLLASLAISVIGILWGMWGRYLEWRPVVTNIGFACLGIGVFAFFYNRRRWKG
jgi:hypothetical protein